MVTAAGDIPASAAMSFTLWAYQYRRRNSARFRLSMPRRKASSSSVRALRSTASSALSPPDTISPSSDRAKATSPPPRFSAWRCRHSG